VLSEFPYTMSQTSRAVACRDTTDKVDPASVAFLGKATVEAIGRVRCRGLR
jgi:hypothetical protein